MLKMLMQHDMNTKKQHEVEIMRYTVSDLVRCCNVVASQPKSAQEEVGHEEVKVNCGGSDQQRAAKHRKVTTLVDIGEGKGYVSRVLSFVDEKHNTTTFKNI